MKRILLLVLISFLAIQLKAQTQKEYYKDVVDNCVKELNQKSNEAFMVTKDFELGRALFDSLVNSCIKGKFLSNYTFRTYDKRTFETDNIDKPIILVTSATWCAPCWGEIPTLNKLANEYSNEFQIIVMFADQKNKLKKMAAKYDDSIWLVPSDNAPSDNSSLRISGFNHVIDFPTAYLINSNKQILDVSRGAAFPNDNMTWEKANEINEKKLRTFIEPIIN